MTAQPKYRKTLLACYLGFITQAITANFAPLLFLTFRDSYGIPLEKIALIPMAFFMTQLLVDFAATKFVDRIGYRTCVVCSQVLSAVGLALLAVLPDVFPDPFVGILISVVLYAVGAGLIEVLISPIVEACPFENKDGMMSLLHSFYCWGSVGVILGSTLFFALFGVNHWRILAVLWAALPFLNAFNFLKCPIERLTEDGEGMRMGQLFRMPLFWLMALLMLCAGASELSMAQWASAFTESAMGVSKNIGDLAGPCLFAVLMGISRVFYSKMSEKLDLTLTMLGCGALCVVCYLMASLCASPVLGLLGCALCGISVGIMWPGTLSISAQKCPKGGTVMFALLALAGDLGGSVGPSLVGGVSSMAGGDLKIGLLAAIVFPVLLIAGLIVLKKWVKVRK
ncbi:MAG: MFS transporter [Clostridiales bacterium]|nr:MFS transporter [Clostridiales bacterium]